MAGQDEQGPPRPGYAEKVARGPVEAANERGIKVAGAWYDFGTFYEGERPTAGQEVELVATGRYLRSVKIDGRAAGGAAPRAAGGSGGGTPPPWDPDDGFAGLDAPGLATGPRVLRRPPAPAGRPGAPSRAVLTPEERAQDRRERRRFACLAAAAHFFAPRPEATLQDVLDSARVLESFVSEPPAAPGPPGADAPAALDDGPGGEADDPPF
jgi:hypothetical protein